MFGQAYSIAKGESVCKEPRFDRYTKVFGKQIQ
jgi:hypothetical protein